VSGALATTTALYALGLSAWALAAATLGRGPDRGQAGAAIVLEAALVAQAIAAVAAIARGHRPADLGVHLAYVAASVCILPAAVASGRSGGSRWDGLVLAVACLGLAVGAAPAGHLAGGAVRARPRGSAARALVAALSLARPGARARRVALGACSLELAGVLVVGALSIAAPARFPDATVWSGFGAAYGFVPLALPGLGLVWLLRGGGQDSRASAGPSCCPPSSTGAKRSPWRSMRSSAAAIVRRRGSSSGVTSSQSSGVETGPPGRGRTE
jgi:hypothetical protein